jgi:(1->4)-alpha-D-glucan 1-alpha-D-glucosylmutase
MRVPVSTYRLQFNKDFRFVDGRDIVPYLHDLGITDLYSSPRYKARRGSSHGYDIANPLRVNSELGTEDDFDDMAEKLGHYEMGLLLDEVPNHMSASHENPWWADVLENGPSSQFASFFDIDWHPTTSKARFLQDNKVLLATLGDLYGNVLENQELSLRMDDTGIFVRYYDTRLPLDPKTYTDILQLALAESPSIELEGLLDDIAVLPDRNAGDPDLQVTRRKDQEVIKQKLWQAYHSVPEVKKAIDDALRVFNGVKGDPRSFDPLDRLLSAQAYRLAYWKIGYEEINYRRFFDINELVGLRVEVPEVFGLRHARTAELAREGKVTGLRIDHVDGLYDPKQYLERVQDFFGTDGGFYVVVEKILGRDERLRTDWPIAGTTGYEFLNSLNGIFIHPAGLDRMQEIYATRTGDSAPFGDISYACNKQAIEQLFSGEANVLGQMLGRMAARDRRGRDLPASELKQALIEVTSWLPVYRTYIRDFEIPESDRAYIESTIEMARQRTPEERVSPAAFDFLRRVLLLEPAYYAEEFKESWLRFVMRWQQFTGPVMAKGLEDTASYVHNRLISQNEVGGDPLRQEPPVDLAGFHAFNQARLRFWPHGLNATSTHDTKRGEDARARINVLSEIPGEWENALNCWMRTNERHKKPVKNVVAPSTGDEILIYQMLLGTWPQDDAERSSYPERFHQFLTKAAREAKVHTSWISPNQDYENALIEFLDAIIHPDSAFLREFLPFQEKIAFFGAINGLAQVLLKICSPGAPDFYQGSELWNFSMVDPDNRRPVNYRKRIDLLDSLKRREAGSRVDLARELAANPLQDAAKLYVTSTCLEFRRTHRELFAEGEYLPVEASGTRSDHLCAFARRLGDQWAIAVAPRWLSQLACRPPALASCEWEETALNKPPEAAGAWHNVLTGQEVRDWRIAELLRDFPVALLASNGTTA